MPATLDSGRLEAAYDGINAGVVAPEAGRESLRGRASLQQAARDLVS